MHCLFYYTNTYVFLKAELMDIDSPEVMNDTVNQSSITQPESIISTVVQQCALGPTRSLGGAAFIISDSSVSRGIDSSSLQNNELVTCNLCLVCYYICIIRLHNFLVLPLY